MIKTMERRFTIVAIAAISLVLLFLVLSVQLISERVNMEKADMILSKIVSENRASVDFESMRTFMVVVSEGEEQGPLIKGDGIVEAQVAEAMALEAIDTGNEKGYIDLYRYLVIEDDDEGQSVIFLDYSFEKQGETILLWVSLAAYVLSVVMVTGLVKFFMKPVMKPIKESYKKQKQFITDASHELKTPLTVIATDMQLIEMESGSTKWTQSVNKQVERLTLLSNNLVELSRMDEKATMLAVNSLNLSDLVSDVVYGFEPALLVEDKRLEINISDGIRVKGNYDAIENMMSIIMDNARKYCDPGGQVHVELIKRQKQYVLSVENTVSNIDEGSHSEYFERFYRADKSRNKKTGGFGIGLAVAKSIAEQHGWMIKAFSHNNHSIAFTVEIPI